MTKGYGPAGFELTIGGPGQTDACAQVCIVHEAAAIKSLAGGIAAVMIRDTKHLPGDGDDFRMHGGGPGRGVGAVVVAGDRGAAAAT